MKKISIYTSTAISSKSTNIIGTEQKSLLKNQENRYIKAKLFHSFQKSYIKKEEPSLSDFFSSEKTSTFNENTSNYDEYSITTDKKMINVIQKDKKYYSKEKHKKLSRLPYNLKHNEILKLKYLNDNMKSQKLPKYSSDYIKDKLNKDIDFPNVNIISKKKKKNHLSCRKFSFISSDKKKFQQKYVFVNDKNEYISFGLYYDKDIIDKNKELDDELIENSSDLDVESDEENKMTGIKICMIDLKYALMKLNENIEYISYAKNNKVKIFNNN